MKRVERSFAYKGIIAVVVGAVVSVPGTIAQWWPQLFAIENSRNIRPMLAMVSLGAGGVLMLCGLAYILFCVARRLRGHAAKSGGHSVEAELLDVEPDFSKLSRGKPSYTLRCLYADENGKRYIFRSLPLGSDPSKLLAGKIKVWHKPGNIKQYYVDVAASLVSGTKEL